MLDRFGKTVRVAWAEHEILWLKAAMTLPRTERWEAFQDISDMTGRTFAAITYQAQRLECARQEDAFKTLRRPPPKACGDGTYPTAYVAGTSSTLRSLPTPSQRPMSASGVQPVPPPKHPAGCNNATAGGANG